MGQLAVLLHFPTPTLTGRDALAGRLSELSALLHAGAPLWQPRPFATLPLPWEDVYPELSRWLRALPRERTEALHADPIGLRDAPAPLPELLDEVLRVTTVGALPAHGLSALPDPVPRVSGRKRAQVAAFVAAAEAALPLELSVLVDWCSGKGHVARTLSAARTVFALGLERDPERCRTARDLAASTPAQCAFVAADVLDRDRWPQVPPLRAGLVGLHACGALTDAAIRFAREGHARALLLAPCCFHFLPGEDPFVPRSEAGRAAGLGWEAATLRLPTLEEVVASPAERTRRRVEMAWRLGLDLLVREATGEDRYTPLGPIRTGWQKGGFRAFAERMAGEQGVALPVRWDPARAEADGFERERLVAALGLARSLFRRPMELWLVLDRALHLAEEEWDVQVGTFCDRTLTPRNLAIAAWHPVYARR